MDGRTIFLWMLRNFLRIVILAIAVSFFVFRASELMTMLNVTGYVEAYYIAEELELSDVFRRISAQEQAWRILHLVLSFVMLTAAFLIIYSFTLLRRVDNGNLLCHKKHSHQLVRLRELAVLLSISAPAIGIGTVLGVAFLIGPRPFELTLFSTAQILGRGLPLPEFWFICMLISCLVLATIVGLFAIKKLNIVR